MPSEPVLTQTAAGDGNRERETGSLRGRVLGGIGWNLATQVVNQATRVAVGVLLARLLSPHEFGIAGMALIFSGFAVVFTDLSLGAALIQRRTIDELDRSTVFWTTLAIGIAFTGLGIGLSGTVASFFGEPQAKPLVAVLAVSFTLSSLGATQQALLTRELAYRSLQLREMAALTAGSIAGVVLAVAGYGPWAIVVQSVVYGAASVVLLWLLSSWRPRPIYSLESLRSLGGFGIKLFGSRLLAYANLNADNLLVGRVLGAAALGTYGLAYNTMFTPMLRIGLPIQQVVAPAFSRMQDDTSRLWTAWTRSKRLSAALLAPAFLAILVTAPDLVPVVFGAKWRHAVPVLQFLCCAGVAHVLVTLNWSVLQARGRAGTLLRLNLLVSAVTVGAFVVGLRWGVAGVAGSYAVAKWVLVLPDTWITCRAIGARTLETLHCSAAAIPSAVAAAIVGYGARVALAGAGAPPELRLALVLATGFAAYVTLIALLAPALVEEVRQLVKRGAVAPAAAA